MAEADNKSYLQFLTLRPLLPHFPSENRSGFNYKQLIFKKKILRTIN